MGLLFEYICTDLLAIGTTVLCIIIAYIKYSHTYWSRRGVAFVAPSLIFGNAGPIFLQEKTTGEQKREIYQQLKCPGRRYAGTYMFHRPELLILDPELAKNVLSMDFNNFHDRGFQFHEKNDPLSAHLASLTGAKWRNLRQKLTPTFTSSKLKLMFEILLKCSNELEVVLDQLIKKAQPIDIKDIFGRFTTDVIGSCAFGLECNSLKDPDSAFRKFGKRILEPNKMQYAKMLFTEHFPEIYQLFKLKIFAQDAEEFFTKIVQETVNYRETNGIKRNDFMQLMINIRNTGDVDKEVSDEPGKSLTINEMTAHAFVFFLAGFESSSTTQTFFFYDMALHQEIQDKVRMEINEMLTKNNGKLTYEGIMELQYLDKALNESMRLHPALPFLQRRCTTDYKMPNSELVVEKGMMVYIPVYGFQSDPEYYPEPEKYDPERFSNEEKAKRHPYIFLPFGEGPRNCIGSRFGLLQTKVGIIMMLKNHKFTLSSKTINPIKFNPKQFLLSVEGGVWLNAEKKV